jgi:hypothetical protein
LKSYWNGNESLQKTFWFLYVFGSIVTAIAISLLVLLVGVIIDFPTYTFAFLSFLLVLLLNPFYLFCWVSVWRSSNNASSIYINRGVKIFIVIHIAFFTYNLNLIPELFTRLSPLYE